MAHQHYFGIMCQQIFNGGQRAHNAVIIGDLTIFILRHIKIYPHKDSLALQVNIPDCFFAHAVSPYIAVDAAIAANISFNIIPKKRGQDKQ